MKKNLLRGLVCALSVLVIILLGIVLHLRAELVAARAKIEEHEKARNASLESLRRATEEELKAAREARAKAAKLPGPDLKDAD
jgi:hypothetical protein